MISLFSSATKHSNNGFSEKPSRTKSSAVTTTASGSFSKTANSLINSKTEGISLFVAFLIFITYVFTKVVVS